MGLKDKIRKISCIIANTLWMAISLYKSILFKRSLFKVDMIQKEVLLGILKKNRQSLFGQEHDFTSIRDIDDFRSQVLIRSYDSYAYHIDLILKGQSNVLTSEPVLMLQPTSGSTAPSKYIPFTKTLKSEFQKGIAPWFFDLYRKRRSLLLGTAYWSITPANRNKKYEKGNIPVGFMDDREYFGLLERYLMKFIFTVPEEVSRIEDKEAFYYVTLLFLLKDRHLSFLSVWNPTFLLLLLKPVCEWSKSLIQDIENGIISFPVKMSSELEAKLLKKLFKDIKRAKELSAIFERWKEKGSLSLKDTSIYEEIWPNLNLISCWADGNSASQVKEIKAIFPNVEIQPKGLIATEGVISFPLIGEKGAVLSVNSHFYEFIEVKKLEHQEEEQDTQLSHQLQGGKLYSVIITTGGGLYRYRLQDIIEVVGFKGRCPLIRFVGRENKVSDLFGEKLNEYHVLSVLNEIFDKYSFSPSFFMIAPENDIITGNHFYTLFLESDKEDSKIIFKSLACEIEEKLQENYHYKYCRKLGQLSELKVFVVNDSGADILRKYAEVCNIHGQRLGNVKPAALHLKMGWSKELCGSFL